MTPYEIPLSPQPQTFSIELSGTSYKLTVFWCKPMNAWALDIAQADGTPLLCGVPLVTGVDLLAQHKHLGIKGQLIVQTDHDPVAVPTFDNLGVTGHLYFTVS